MLTRRFLLLGLVAGLALGQPATARGNEQRTARLDAELNRLVEGGSTPGIVALILENGRPAYVRAVGRRAPGAPAPIGLEGVFRYASMTKPVTSTAALILVEEGKLGLDDPITRHLPAFGNLRLHDGTAAAAPTIRQLLTHTAGFSYGFINNPRLIEGYRQARVTDGLAEPELDTAEAMRRLAAAPLAYAPGEGWEYSLATDVLGAVIETVSGQPLGAFVTERIARPLGLRSWVWNVNPLRRDRFVPVTRPAQVTGALGTGVVPVAAVEDIPFPSTGGLARLDPDRVFAATAYHSGGAGMSGNITDYARFAQMLLNGGEVDGVRILRPETARLLATNQIGDRATSRGPGWGFSLGMGVVTDQAAARTGLPNGSYGCCGIYGTQFWVDPANRVVGVVMTQTAIIGSGPIANAVREAFYRAE
jgi:CubicO group peptidase (beta-lactamase class C family)